MNEEDNFLNEMKKATAMRDSELKSKFKTMLFSYRNALGMLSGLKNELDEVVNHIDNLDIETISNFYKPVLDKANDLGIKIENLDDDIRYHTDMKEYLSSIKSHNIDTWVRKLDEVKYQIVKAKEAEERRKQELQRQRNEEAKRQELQRQRNEESKRQAELERQQREEIVTFNGLMWGKETHNMDWYDTMEYAKNLRFGGYDDWRLPTKEELGEVIQSCKRDTGVIKCLLKLYVDYFESKGFDSSLYWSSTSISGYTDSAWVVFFHNGLVGNNDKDNNVYLRCVRAGQ